MDVHPLLKYIKTLQLIVSYITNFQRIKALFWNSFLQPQISIIYDPNASSEGVD
jgi:hypothetical protein